MVPALDNVQKVRRFHLTAHSFEQIQRTKQVAGALDKENWRRQDAQNFVTELCPITHRAQRISETNKSIHFFFERHMTTDAPTHALANQDGRSDLMSFSRLTQCFPMCRDQF